MRQIPSDSNNKIIMKSDYMLLSQMEVPTEDVAVCTHQLPVPMTLSSEEAACVKLLVSGIKYAKNVCLSTFIDVSVVVIVDAKTLHLALNEFSRITISVGQ